MCRRGGGLEGGLYVAVAMEEVNWVGSIAIRLTEADRTMVRPGERILH